MIVVAVVAILAGTVVGMIDRTRDDATREAARAELATLRDACLRFKLDNGRWPLRSGLTTPVPTPADHGLAELLVGSPVATAPYSHVAWNADTRRGFRGPYLSFPRALIDTDGNGPDLDLVAPKDGVADFLPDPWFESFRQGGVAVVPQTGANTQPDHTYKLVEVTNPAPAHYEIHCFPDGLESSQPIRIEVR